MITQQCEDASWKEAEPIKFEEGLFWKIVLFPLRLIQRFLGYKERVA